jgi:hypothetical protein
VAPLYHTEGIFARGRKGFFAASLVKMGGDVVYWRQKEQDKRRKEL